MTFQLQRQAQGQAIKNKRPSNWKSISGIWAWGQHQPNFKYLRLSSIYAVEIGFYWPLKPEAILIGHADQWVPVGTYCRCLLRAWLRVTKVSRFI